MPEVFRSIVAPPTRVTLPYSLLTASQLIDETDVHWRGGVLLEVDTCSTAGITTETCAATGGVDKPETNSFSIYGGVPFTVYTRPLCSTVAYIESAQTRAVNALIQGENRAVEREFWTGEHGITPHLAEDTAVVTALDNATEQTAATVLVTGAVDPVEGLARLEEALGECYGSEGVIHVPPSVNTHLVRNSVVQRDGLRLRSPSNHLIAVGAGYPGTSPAGAEPATGVRWIYATGAVQVRRSAIEVKASLAREIVNRQKNDVVLVAERTYVITWECCHFAIPVSIGGEVSGAYDSSGAIS